MEHVTDFTLNVQGRSIPYQVLFHDEVYTFQPAEDHSSQPAFNVHRQNNDWKVEDEIDKEVASQAVEQLEKFLLSQH